MKPNSNTEILDFTTAHSRKIGLETLDRGERDCFPVLSS